MKRILLAVVILLAAGIFAYAQQPTSNQTKQAAQQFLTESRANESQFETTLNDLIARNRNNLDAITFNQLKAEIDRLSALIDSEETRAGHSLDRGARVSSELMNRIQRLLDQHKSKTAELESFIAN